MHNVFVGIAYNLSYCMRYLILGFRATEHVLGILLISVLITLLF